jgi:hypothetical protein
MADERIRTLGTVRDFDSIPVHVGVDYDTVTLNGLRFDRAQVEELAQLIVAASWEAAACGARMAAEAVSDG